MFVTNDLFYSIIEYFLEQHASLYLALHNDDSYFRPYSQ